MDQETTCQPSSRWWPSVTARLRLRCRKDISRSRPDMKAGTRLGGDQLLVCTVYSYITVQN